MEIQGNWLRLSFIVVIIHGVYTYNSTTEVPYIAGQWTFTYEYSEMYGSYAGYDGLKANPCKGPFPYQFTWIVNIWQLVNKTTGKTSGKLKVCWNDWMKCETDARDWDILQSNKDNILSVCPFRPYDERMAYALNGELAPPGYRGSKGVKQDPPALLWTKFAVPLTNPYVWGAFCNQYSWPDQSGKISKLPTAPYYRGSIRYENESWVVLRAINTCPCFPACSVCEETIPGTNLKQVMEDGGACLASFGVSPSQCQLIIQGVSGGPVRFPVQTLSLHGNKPNGDEDQVCFTYATITGTRNEDETALPIVKLPTWNDDIGDPNNNRNPG